MEIQWGSCKFREGLQFITQVHELDLIPLPRTEDILRILWLIALWLLSQSLTPSIHAPCTLLVFFFFFCLPLERGERDGQMTIEREELRGQGTSGCCSSCCLNGTAYGQAGNSWVLSFLVFCATWQDKDEAMLQKERAGPGAKERGNGDGQEKGNSNYVAKSGRA